MGKRDNKVLSLVGVDLADADNGQLKEYFASTLKCGMHGIGFSAYEEGQKPGDNISLTQIKRRMDNNPFSRVRHHRLRENAPGI